MHTQEIRVIFCENSTVKGRWVVTTVSIGGSCMLENKGFLHTRDLFNIERLKGLITEEIVPVDVLGVEITFYNKAKRK